MNFGSSLQAVKSRIAEQVNRVRGASQDQSENDEPKISDEPSSDTTSALVRCRLHDLINTRCRVCCLFV